MDKIAAEIVPTKETYYTEDEYETEYETTKYEDETEYETTKYEDETEYETEYENELETEEMAEMWPSAAAASHCVITFDCSVTERPDHRQVASMVTHCLQPVWGEEEVDISSFQVHQSQDQFLVPATDQNIIWTDDPPPVDSGEVCMDVETCDIDGDNEDAAIKMCSEPSNTQLTNEYQTSDYLDTANEDSEDETIFESYCLNEPSTLDTESFLISMVTHQLPFTATPDEFPSCIMSSVSHHCIKLEEDFHESLTTMVTHFTNHFYENAIIEDVNEDLLELTDDAMTEYTDVYTDNDNLDTIIEVSEMCDLTDAAEESEFAEEIKDISQVNNACNEHVKYIESNIPNTECNETFENCSIYHTPGYESMDEDESILCEYDCGEPELSETELFHSSMVSHQLAPLAPPDEFPSNIMSSVVHQSIMLDEDFSGPQSSLASHCSFNFYDSGFFEDIIESIPEDIIDDCTEYTEVYTETEDHLDTILEVSEACDITDQTDMTDTEMFEEIEDLLTSMDVNTTDAIIWDNQDHVTATQNSVDTDSSLLDTYEDNVLTLKSEDFKMYMQTTYLEEEDKYQECEEVHQDESIVSMFDETADSEGKGGHPSMVSHCVGPGSLEEEYHLLPSPASHLVNMVTEVNDFDTMLSHLHPVNNIQTQEQILAVQQEPMESFVEEDIHVGNTEQGVSCDQTGLSEDLMKAHLIDTEPCNMKQKVESVTEAVVCEETKVVLDSTLPQSEERCCQDQSSSAAPAANNYPEESSNTNTYKLQLTRIQQLQKLVEDELEEFESKRKDKVNIEQATETQIVNIVKGVEFITNICMKQTLEDEEESKEDCYQPKEEQLFSEDEDFSEQTTTEEGEYFVDESAIPVSYAIRREEQIAEECQPSVEIFSEEEDSTDQTTAGENLIHASCTLRNDNTVAIRSNFVNSSHSLDKADIADVQKLQDNSGENDNNERNLTEANNESAEATAATDSRLNDLKLQLRAPPRKSKSKETKIRDKQLLDSLFGDTEHSGNILMTDNNEGEKDPTTKPSILKPSKTPVKIATATFNENVKKQSYRIKFKIKLDENSQKKQSSVLRYLFGCFGGEKLFNAQLK